MKKYTIVVLVITALLSACGKPGNILPDNTDDSNVGSIPIVGDPSDTTDSTGPSDPSGPSTEQSRETVINFETDALNKTYEFTKGDNDPASVKVVNDPMRSGQKSLQISTNDGGNNKGYNQAAVIPINLPYALENYQTFSFKFCLVSGNTGTNLNAKSIMVYAAKNTSTFVKWGFGNPSSDGNQFAANLLGEAPSPTVNFDDSYKNEWTDYTITIVNPDSVIKDLSGDIFVAIGINCQNTAEYLGVPDRRHNFYAEG